MLITTSSYNIKLNITLTILIVILFIIYNPFYALFLSAMINVMYKKINYKVFSFVFALSFALIFTNRSVGGSGDDIGNYISLYQSDMDIFRTNLFIEPFWVIYNKILLFVFRGNIDLFVGFNYFIMFLMLIIISRSVNKDNYIVVSFFLIYFNLGILYAIYHLWRHSYALLILYVGIYNIRARGLIYFAPLFHIVSLPLMFATKITIKNIAPLIIISYILYIYMHNKVDSYSASNIDAARVNTYIVLSAIIIFILKYLQLIKLNQIENRVFYGLITFAFAPIILEIPSIAYGRATYIFMFFNSIIIAKLVVRTGVWGIALIPIYIVYRLGFSFTNPDIMHFLKYLGDDKPLFLFNGIALLLNDYDINRWSDYMSAY
jgi:hypothetical protein